MKPRWVVDAILPVAALLIGYVVGQYMAQAPAAPVGVAVEAPPSKIVADVPTVAVPCKAPIVTYAPAAKKKLRLPQAVADAPSAAVIAATDVRPDIHPHTITSVLDVETGKTTTYDTRMALPLLAPDAHGEAGAMYGRTDAGDVVRLMVRQGFVDVKAWRIEGAASFDVPLSGSPRWFAGLGAVYRW